MTPYLRWSLEFRADIVMHSATKYLGRHSDLVEELAITSEKKIAERLAFTQNATDGACELAKKEGFSEILRRKPHFLGNEKK